jgi:Spy/CpxP family protein refolding chaperone
MPPARLKAYFELSDAQLAKIDGARKKLLKKRSELRVKAERLHLRIQREHLADKIDTKKIISLEQKIEKTWDELEEQRQAFRKKVKDVLTDEQEEKLPPRWR